MARRRRGMFAMTPTTLRGEINIGQKTIEKLSDRVAYAMVKFDHDPRTVPAMLFDAETRAKANAAEGIIDPARTLLSYDVGVGTLSVNWRDLRQMPIMASAMRLQPASAALIEALTELQEINRKFSVVNHVLDWLNKNATPGAMRYYWPTILSLIPDSKILCEADGARHKEPSGISAMLPLIRETANTVASALLLPETEKKPANNVYVGFGGFNDSQFNHPTGTEINVVSHTYNLC